MKKIIILLLSVILTFSLTTACDWNDRDNTDNIIIDEIRIKGDLKISLYKTESDNMKSAVDAYVEAYSEVYPYVHITKDYVPKYEIPKRISSRDIGDVFFFQDTDFNELAVNNYLMPLNYYFQAFKIDTDNVLSAAFDCGKYYDRNIYGVSCGLNRTLFAYNADVIQTAGLSELVKPGWTWEDFLEICSLLADSEYYGADIDLTYGPYIIPFLNANLQYNWYDTTGKTLHFKDDLYSLKVLSEAVDAHADGFIRVSHNVLPELFEGKTPVFTAVEASDIEEYGKIAYQQEYNWDLIPLPTFDHNSVTVSSLLLGVNNRTMNPNAAASFAAFMYTESGQRAFNSHCGYCVPSLISLQEENVRRESADNWKDKNWDALVYNIEKDCTIGQFDAIFPPEIAVFFSSEAIDGIIINALNGIMTVTDGFSEIQDEVNQLWPSLNNGQAG